MIDSTKKVQTREEAEKALEELSTWLKERGLSVGGCGCCGSPWLGWNDEEGKLRYLDNIQAGVTD